MYVARASRPDATHAVSRLARNVTDGAKIDDADLAQVMGYLRATHSSGMEMAVDVRDKRGILWLERYADADHAGEDDRCPIGGWALMLRGSQGA